MKTLITLLVGLMILLTQTSALHVVENLDGVTLVLSDKTAWIVNPHDRTSAMLVNKLTAVELSRPKSRLDHREFIMKVGKTNLRVKLIGYIQRK